MYPILIWKAKSEFSDDKDKKDIEPPNLIYVNKDSSHFMETNADELLILLFKAYHNFE
jgi:hypothetical protein